ncbi:MAG: ATP-binding protein, partial [bacterium]
LPKIEKVTLEEALSSAVDRHARISSTEVRTGFRNIDWSAPAALKTVAYRVVQEALSNALRHAGGSGQTVLAVRTATRLRIIVSDSGPGFPDSAVAEKDFGLGLTGMLQRVLAADGDLRIRSVKGKWTCVKVTLPLDLPT